MCCCVMHGFFDCTSVLMKSVAEMTFSLAYVFNFPFFVLYHIDKIGRRAGDIMYTSLFVGRENSVRRGSLYNERTTRRSCAYFCVVFITSCEREGN